MMDEFAAELDEGTEEERLYRTYENYYNELVQIVNQIIELSSANEDEKANNMANNQLSQVGENVGKSLDDLKAYEKAAMDEAVANSQSSYESSVSVNTIMFVLAIVAAWVAIVIVHFEIINPLVASNNRMQQITSEMEARKGDLTKRIEVTGKDELSRLAAGINGFLTVLQGIMVNISQENETLNQIVTEVTENVTGVNVNACDVSATMQELSASMQEVAATASNVNENAVTIKENVVELASESSNLQTYADEMEQRASELENTAVANMKNTSTIVNRILEELKIAIEDSKGVDKVNDLTNEILSISSQLYQTSIRCRVNWRILFQR